MTCAPGATAYVDVSVQQVRRGVQSYGSGNAEISCTGATQTVWFTITSEGGPDFSTGRAYSQGNVGACTTDPFECSDLAEDETALRIRR